MKKQTNILRSKINELKKEQKVSNYKLAKVVGMQPTQIKRYLSGEQDTASTNVERMLIYLGFFR